MRGENWVGRYMQEAGLWYTPTCVGKTLTCLDHNETRQVHPHMRGENAVIVRDGHPWLGTPPHAWGKREAKIQAMRFERYTPTCVGKTTALRRGSSEHMVHPHMRGENGCARWRDRADEGTPPHAWGKPRFHARARR